MVRSKVLAILLSLCLLLTQFAVPVAATQTRNNPAPAASLLAPMAVPAEPGPKSATVGNDVFLHGNFIEVGISKSGSFGTANEAPAGFHPTIEGGGKLGFNVDKDGFDTGNPPTTGDFFLPGDPEESFTIGYKDFPEITAEPEAASESEIVSESEGVYNFTNSERTGDIEISCSTTDISSGNTLAAKTEGVTDNDKIKLTQVVSFDVNDKFFKNAVTLTNQSVSENVYSLRYMRNFDPDQDVELYDEFDTLNAVLENPPQNDRAIVRATGAESGEPVFLVAFDDRARASTYGFSNRDVYDPNIYDVDGSNLIHPEEREDAAIAMTFDFGTLAPGQSVTFTYYTSLNENFDEGLAEIIHNTTLSNSSVEEHCSNGTTVGTLSLDSPCDGTHTYTLIDNADGRFTLDGNTIKVNNGSLLDYNTATSHTIKVRLTCSKEEQIDKNFVISVTPQSWQSLRPVLDGITVSGSVYIAHWGWKNENFRDITVPLSDTNKFTGSIISGPSNPPTEFVSGRVYNAFTTEFDGSNLVWTLKGPDGSTRTATASKTGPLFDETRFLPLRPVLEGVTYDVASAVYTAHWGWKNDCDFLVTVPHSDSRFNRTENIPVNNFAPGRYRDQFDTEFDGNNLVWTLRGPNDETRTATASNAKVLTAIQFDKESYSLEEGKNCNVTVTAFYSDGTTSDITSIATYLIGGSEGTSGIATISSTGLLTGTDAGSATIHAEYLGVPASAEVTVTEPSHSGGGGGGSSSEAPPIATLVDRVQGYVSVSPPVKITEVKSELVLSFDQKALAANPKLSAKVYYWNSEHNKWVALATYPAGDGKVKAVNDGGYKGWFKVFGIIQPTFSDVQGHWAEPVINRMNGLGMIEGYSSGNADELVRLARPNQSVTRTEFAAFLYRMLNIDPDRPLLAPVSQEEAMAILTEKFSDAEEIPAWARPMVAALVDAGYLSGRNGKFDGSISITRIEAAVMVSNALKDLPGYKAADFDQFKDASDIPDWAKAAVGDNLVTGYPDGSLKPNETISRAEALTVLQKLFVNALGW